MQRSCLYRSAQTLLHHQRPITLIRRLASKRTARSDRQWPRLAYGEERGTGLSRDPAELVRSAHENERNAFRYALDNRDFAGAYQLYEEQRHLPILSGAEVTALVQLISADAKLRKLNGYEQPESLQDVFWTIIDDVKDHKVPGQMMLWTHALDALVTWNHFEEAEELWRFLQTLPNRVSVDKHDAHCIDSRVYASAVKLYTALGDFDKADALYREALDTRKLQPSLMLEQAMIGAYFQSKRIGDGYKAMDRAIREQRRALRPAFFNDIISLALDAGATGIATEVFMKACKVNMLPASSRVTRLLSALARSRIDPLESVLTIFKHYQALNDGRLSIEHANCVIDALFNSADHEVPKTEVLSRVHELLQEMQNYGVRSTSTTINILIKGYIKLGEYVLADDLLARAALTENTFRTMLKALAEARMPECHSKVRECWHKYEAFQRSAGRAFSARDLQMLMRAGFATDSEATKEWIGPLIQHHSASLDQDAQHVVVSELERHLAGTFIFTTKRLDHSANREASMERAKWLSLNEDSA